MSAIESAAPTSWNATASTAMPWTRALGVGQMPEDAERVRPHRRREVRRLQRGADLRPGPVAVVVRAGPIVAVLVAVIVAVIVGMRVFVGRGVFVPVRRGPGHRTGHLTGRRHGEARAAEDPVIVGPDRAGDARVDRPDAGGHAGLMLGEGVQQGGGEHVAGDAAERVEVDVHRVSRGRPWRMTGPPQIGRGRPAARRARPPRPRRIARAAQESCR